MSPTEDLHIFGEQMVHMAHSLKIKVVISEHKPNEKILRHLYSESLGMVVFSALEGLEDFTLWQKTCISPAYI